MPDFIPGRESQLVPFTLNIAVRGAAEAVALGLTPVFMDEYVAAQTLFTNLFNEMNDPGTRTPAKRISKDQAKKQLIAKTRELARIVQANPYVTDEMRGLLGLPIHKTEPTPEPVPTDFPEMDILSVVGNLVKVRVHGDTTGRRKPEGVYAAVVLRYVGETPPADPSLWASAGSTTRTTFTVEFPITVAPGTKVWLTAAWVNARLQAGPLRPAVSTFTQYGGLSQAA